eukprot:TRINITY_DN819_c0_g1_i2.p1 TRINITY_DN819_c0_g1~~TRINITY_DN819_c0_g1_i2.p1  ORF type:complete len:325 (+),score=127.25 TRINITY_DN819_c0_g1_i2:81-1055(+)
MSLQKSTKKVLKRAAAESESEDEIAQATKAKHLKGADAQQHSEDEYENDSDDELENEDQDQDDEDQDQDENEDQDQDDEDQDQDDEDQDQDENEDHDRIDSDLEDEDDADDEEEEQEEEDDDNDEDEQEKPKVLGFAGVIGKLLSQELEKETPILAKRPAITSKIQEEKVEEKTKEVIRETRKERAQKGHVPLEFAGGELEKRLLKVATKGVVKLFNAVNKHQKMTHATSGQFVPRQNRGAAPLSKDNFLKMLREAPTRTAKSASDTQSQSNSQQASTQASATAKWDVLRDDFVTKPKPSEPENPRNKRAAKKMNDEDITFAFP